MIRSSRIRHYVAVLERLGIKSTNVLAGTGISKKQLNDPSLLITPKHCHRIVENMVSLSGDPSLGLRVGESMDFSDFGVVGYAMASSKTAKHVLGLWIQYANDPLGYPFEWTVSEEKRGSRWSLSARPFGVPQRVVRFYIEEMWAMGGRFGPLLMGQPYVFEELHFTYDGTAKDKSLYESYFHCPITFGAPSIKIQLCGPSLSSPVTASSELRSQFLIDTGIANGSESYAGTAAKLREQLIAAGSFPSLGSMAEQLNVSARTLRRQLAFEGTTYQTVLDQLRRELADEYLASGMRSKQVTYLLGFSGPDAFSRAYKTWTGKSPSSHSVEL